jgi:branched-chain amino acid transport system substrate-binding protein
MTPETRATTAANKVVDHPQKPLIVIGHRFSSVSTFAGPIYKENKIPAITASAPSPSVTEDNEWYFRVIIENNRQGHFVAHYIKEILKYETMTVIYQDSEYGRTLGKAAVEQAQKLGMNLPHPDGYGYQSEGLTEEERFSQLPSIVDEVLSLEDPGMIVLAVGDGDGAILVNEIRKKKPKQPILEGLITQRFDDDFRELSGANRSKYLENLWTTQHLIYDTGNILAQEFKKNYEAKFSDEPDAAAAAYYDAAMVAVKAIMDSGVAGSNTTEDRNNIRKELSKYTSLDPDLRGTTGYIYFDPETRSAIKPVPIGIYDNGVLISAPIQLQAIPNIELIRDRASEIRKGNVFEIDGVNFYKTQVVYTGIDLNEISNLDMKSSTFTADFYIWFRYNGEFDESKIEFVNATSPVNLGTPIAEDTFNGQTYYAYRVKADFKSIYNFRAYPFDRQTINITIRNRDLTREQLTFVRDDLRLLNNQAQKEQLNKAIEGGWEVINVQVYTDVLRSDSTLGNPRLSNAGVEYSIFNTDTIIKRDAVNFSIKNLFPIFAVLVLAYLAFYIPPSEFGMRVSLGINAIMTTAFFSLKVSSDLPSIGYITVLEYIFFMTYSLAIFVIVLAITIFFANKQENQKMINRLTWAGRILFPIVMVGTGYFISAIINSVQ